MSILIKGLSIDSHRVIKCFIVPYKDRAQLVIGNKYDAGKTYDIFEVPTPHGDLIDRDKLKPYTHIVKDRMGKPIGLSERFSIKDIKDAPTVIESEE